ncbi:MAG: hypothetical protein ABIN48_04540 [Ginsengibacter sp.]
MKKIKSIQLKAAFLLIVFSLNTIIGFACAVGFDMSFNSSHHGEEVTDNTIPLHEDGKKHHHHNEVKSHHEEAENHLHKTTNNKDNCCHDKVTQIAQQDKIITPSIDVITPVFFTTFIASFYDINILNSVIDSHVKLFIRSHHPPIPDIRIAIQSFQI